MNITICNFASIPERDVERVCAAINRQLTEHFAAHWSVESRIQLRRLGARHEADSGGDKAIIYLWDKVDDVPSALVDEEPRDHGLPFGFVIAEISEQLQEPWSVTLSREALALIGDAHVRVPSAAPHADPSRLVFHWYEMCDAVEAETYEIDRVPVSSVLDNYHPGGALRSFGVGAKEVGG